MRNRLRDLFTTNLAYKGLALAFALMMWVWVQSEQVVEDRARVRLDWRLPDGLALVEPPLESATVSVEGVRGFVRGVRQKQLSMLVDLSKAREGEVSLDLTERPVTGLPGEVRVVSVAPESLKVQLDRVLKRRVNVTPVTHGDPATGYRLGRVTVKPDRVELSGPSSVLRGLTEVGTDTIELGGLREDAEFEVGLALRPGQLTPTVEGRFTVSVRVEPIVKERSFEVPVVVEGDAWKATIERVTVTLSGPTDRLDAVDPADVRAVVHVPDGFAAASGSARRGTDGLRYEIERPEAEALDVAAVTPSTISVERR
jgi:YbbR domain-containing protein